MFSAGFGFERKPVHCVRASNCPKVGILIVMAALPKFSPEMDHDDNVPGHRKGVLGAFKSFLSRDKQKELTLSESGHEQPALEIRESVRDYLQSLLTLSNNKLMHSSLGTAVTIHLTKQNL